ALPDATARAAHRATARSRRRGGSRGESRSLRDALYGRSGVRYTEFTVFRHMDPSKGKSSAIALARELARFGCAIYPLFGRPWRRDPARGLPWPTPYSKLGDGKGFTGRPQHGGVCAVMSWPAGW